MRHFFFILFLLASACCFAQRDTMKNKLATTSLFKDSNAVRLTDSTPKKIIRDTAAVVAKPKHDPKKATFRSAVLPGWGQAYNQQYWKIPIVYGALSIPAITYVFNSTYYKRTRFAYEAVYDSIYLHDNSLLPQVSSKVKFKGQVYDLPTYQAARNSYKRNKDYSLLWFLILWGVNVADATVFGHLKDFDVSDDLTLQVNPSYVPATKSAGLSFVFKPKNPAHKTLPSF